MGCDEGGTKIVLLLSQPFLAVLTGVFNEFLVQRSIAGYLPYRRFTGGMYDLAFRKQGGYTG